MNILVTGGTGFIGSHAIVELLAAGHHVVAVDNFCNSTVSVVEAIEKVASQQIVFKEADVRDTSALTQLLKEHDIDAVIHFGALKAVGESVAQPLRYYQNNIGGLLSVLEAMQQADVKKLVFSSSATVYGDPDIVPINEEAPLKTTTNPYGETKQMAERIITDCATSGTLQAINLRYFNPIGAHPSGLLGESPSGVPNNLVPYVVQAAAGIRDELTVHGDDYETPDGSGVRDYIHVVDLAKAHVKALEYIQEMREPVDVFNIGTGAGVSVLEIIRTFEEATGVKVPYIIGPRRPGDIATCYASPAKAEKLLSWKTEKTLNQALKDAWHWQQESTPPQKRS